MRLAFVTMVWRDYYFLDLWLRTNGAVAGRENLFVISHGPDDRIREMCQGANLITIPRDEPDANFDETRWNLMSDIASGLVRYYDRVVVGDVDEILISLTPGRRLAETLFQASLGAVTAPAGYELFPEDDRPIDDSRPILQQCWQGVLSATYSKPCILTQPARLSAGGHGSKTPFDILPHVALLHLRFLNTAELVARRTERKAIADAATSAADREQSAFLRGWRRAEDIRAKIEKQFRKAPAVPSGKAPARALAALEASRQRKKGHHSFSVPTLRSQDFRLVLDPALRDLF